MIKLFKLKDNNRLQRKNTFFRYSVDEQFTGEYWIDGKKIYCKTIVGSISAFGTGNVAHGVENIGSYRCFDFNNSFWIVYNQHYHLGRWEGNTAFLGPGHIADKYMNLQVGSSWLADTNISVYITIRYTKK